MSLNNYLKDIKLTEEFFFIKNVFCLLMNYWVSFE